MPSATGYAGPVVSILLYAFLSGGAAGAVALDRQLPMAVHDTDTAASYVESTVDTSSTPGQTIHRVLRNEDDLAHNRGRTHAEYTITTRTGGRTRTIRYTLDLIMLDGRTYYRNSLHDKTWKVKRGTEYTDVASGDHWVGGGLSFSGMLRYRAYLVAHTSGQLEYRFQAAGKPYPGHFTVEVWVSAGSHPYILRVLTVGGYIKNGQRHTDHRDTRLSDYDRPLDIRAP